MSIRFHKQPAIITLFHDATNPASQQVLQLLTSYQRNPHHPTATASALGKSEGEQHAGSHGESCIIEANGHDTGATEYLRQARADLPSGLPIQLEVVDRKKNPPTSDQLRSIVDYLAADTGGAEGTEGARGAVGTTSPSGTSSSLADLREGMAAQQAGQGERKGEGLGEREKSKAQQKANSARYTSSGFDLAEHERRKQTLAQHLDKSSSSGSGMPKIKDGPLVVNWDEGSAATSLEGVREMLKRLQEQSEAEERGRASKDGGGCTIC